MKQTHMMYGALTAIAYIIVSVVLYLVGLAFESWTVLVVYGVFLGGILLNAFTFSKANEHYVTFGNVFSSCFKATAIIALILLAWYFISLWIFPEMREEGMEMARQKMQDTNLSDEQIEANLKIANSTAINVAGVVFGTMFVGAIFSLIGAAVAKKKGERPPGMSI
jgi:hypothetical protein